MSQSQKIGLITCHRIPNHGSYLQAWCLCEYLRSQGKEIEIIDYIYPNLYHLNQVQKNEIERNTDTRTLIKKLKRWIIDKTIVCNTKRGWGFILYQAINTFLRNPNKLYFRQLMLSKRSYRSPEELRKSSFAYDILLSGSDQIWNPRFTGADGSFFLQFGDNNIRRVAYSSSFGVTEISHQYQNKYASWLKTFSYISTRENSGKDIVWKLINRESTHVLDPVMLFNRNEWSKILRNSKCVEPKSDKYIVTYCLDYVYKGIINYADSIMAEIAHYYGLQCATLYRSNIDNENVKIYPETIHPFEFVNTILNADFALVSSFHGLAFCILFHTPFLVVINNEHTMDSRLTDILNTFELNDRILKVGDDFKIADLKLIDWQKVDRIYTQMSTISKNYLRLALKP